MSQAPRIECHADSPRWRSAAVNPDLAFRPLSPEERGCSPWSPLGRVDSPQAEAVWRWAGWTPERQVDAAEWIRELRNDGNTVFALAEAIMRSYGGIRLRHRGFRGRSEQDLEVRPWTWTGERETVEFIEEVVSARVCPLGLASGAAMLAICEDGRVLLEFDGSLLLIGQDWPAAMDNLILGRGENIHLAEDYEPLDPPRS